MPEDPIPPLGHAGVIPASLAPDLARELTGDLPCVRCGYNLKSMSIRGVCPECGAPVRATILAKVDPYAEVLRPLSSPRLTVVGLLLCTFGVLAAGALTWGLRAADATDVWAAGHAPVRVVQAGTGCLLAAALGALLIARPHAGLPLKNELSALA